MNAGTKLAIEAVDQGVVVRAGSGLADQGVGMQSPCDPGRSPCPLTITGDVTDQEPRIVFCPMSTGRNIENTVPRWENSSELRTLRLPPCFLTRSSEIQRPSPDPVTPFVVKKGSKIFSATALLIPLPVSATVTLTPGFPSSRPRLGRIFSRKVPPRREASMALPTRFASTCLISP